MMAPKRGRAGCAPGAAHRLRTLGCARATAHSFLNGRHDAAPRTYVRWRPVGVNLVDDARGPGLVIVIGNCGVVISRLERLSSS